MTYIVTPSTDAWILTVPWLGRDGYLLDSTRLLTYQQFSSVSLSGEIRRGSGGIRSAKSEIFLFHYVIYWNRKKNFFRSYFPPHRKNYLIVVPNCSQLQLNLLTGNALPCKRATHASSLRRSHPIQQTIESYGQIKL